MPAIKHHLYFDHTIHRLPATEIKDDTKYISGDDNNNGKYVWYTTQMRDICQNLQNMRLTPSEQLRVLHWCLMSISNHWQIDILFSLSGLTAKKPWKLHIIAILWGESSSDRWIPLHQYH